MNRKGFTLIELMVVVVIISILSSIAMTRVGSLVNKAKEARTKGDLAGIRAEVRIYYVDTTGIYPPSLAFLVENGYLKGLPPVKIAQHKETSGEYVAGFPDESGGNGGKWFYDPVEGHAAVNCTHNAINGDVISSW